MFNSKGRQGGGAVQVEFLHRIRTMFLNGLYADAKRVGDLPVLLTFGHQFDDYPFPFGQCLNERIAGQR